LRLERKPCRAGRWGSRMFVIIFFRPATSGRFERRGENAHFFIDHSQVSQVIGNRADPA